MEKKFIEELISFIVDKRNSPKVQVERALSPILEIFIESVMNELANKGVIWEGEYELIAPEFPLDNEEEGNLRSTNIDFLLFNKSESFLVFVELKTDSHSFNTKQYEQYEKYITENKSEDLYAFLYKLANDKYQKYYDKYQKYKEKIDKKLEDLKLVGLERVSIKIIYIAPKKLTKENKHQGEDRRKAIANLTENRDVERFVTFEDMKNNNTINHKFAEEWEIITKYIEKLDDN
jgi:hypothetical protein